MLNNTLFICNRIKQKYYVSDIFDRKSKTRIEVHIMENSHTVALLFHVQESIGGSQKLFYFNGLNFYWDMIEIPWMIVVILFITDLPHGGIKTSQERKAESLTIAKENGNRLLSIVYAIEFPSHLFLSVENLDHVVIA